MADDQVKFGTPTPPPDQNISFPPEGSVPAQALPEHVADARASRLSYGVQDQYGVDKDTAKDAINSGKEQDLRYAVAAEKQRRDSDAKVKLVQDLAAREGGRITPDQLKFINDKYSVANFLGTPTPVDPDRVFEDYYSGKYLGPMYDISDQFNHGTFLPEAQQRIPDHVKDIQDTATGLLANREIIRNRLELARARLADQSYVGRGLDVAKTFVPGYSEAFLKGGWSQIFNGLRGANLRQQALADWALPPDKLKETFDARMTELESRNPAMAVEYGEHMLGFSTSKEHLDNLFSAIDASAIPAGAIGKVAGASIKGIAGVTGVTKKLSELADLRNAATAAARTAVEQSSNEQGIPLRNLVNQHFGNESARIAYELQTWHNQFKAIRDAEIGEDIVTPAVNPDEVYQTFGVRVPPTAETRQAFPGFANEGLKSQALDRVVEQINKLERQQKDLKNWHAEQMVHGATDYEDQATKTYKDIYVGEGPHRDPRIGAPAARGDLKTAGVEATAQTVEQELKGVRDPAKSAIDALTDNLRSDLAKEVADPGHGGQEVANRLLEGGNSVLQKLTQAVTNIQRVQRIPGILANREAIKAIQEYTKDLYPGIKNAILNISDPILNRTLNTYTQKMFFGRMDGTFFESKAGAEQFAEMHGLTGIATVKPQGNGWYFEVEKPLDETMQPIRDWLIKTKESESPKGWLNAAVGWLRTPEDTLSVENNLQRKLAVYNAAPFMSFAKEAMREVRSLGSIRNVKDWHAQWKEWERSIDFARTAKDADGKPGYFFETGQQLDDFWLRNFDHLPSPSQKVAYFQFKRIAEYDRILRTMAVARNKLRLGVESHTVSILDKEGNIVQSPAFEGVTRGDLPGGVSNVFIAQRAPEQRAIYPANGIPKNTREELEDQVKKGELRVIEIYDPSLRSLSGFNGVSDERIRYVIARNSKAEPIDLSTQVPRRGGGHFEYDYDHYIKQASIKYDQPSNTHWYEGDTTVMPVAINRMGKDIATKLNAVRELINEGKIDEAKNLAQSPQGIPAIPWDQHLGWYLPSKDAQGKVVPPRLSKTEPILTIPSGSRVSEVDNSLKEKLEKSGNFQDGTTQGSLAKTNNVQFTGERDTDDLFTLNDTGTAGNPLYKWERADLVDPITTMNRALSRIVNSTLMDDYKIYSVESWIREARNWLDVGNRKLTDIDSSPFYYFNNPKWNSNTPIETRRLLEGQKAKIDRLVGIPNSTDTFLHSASQALADSVYGSLGPKGALVPTWGLAKLRDPTKFLRSIVFNEKMGLFSVPQFLVHAMTFANVLGIAGLKNGGLGAMHAILHGYAQVNGNPEILEALDKIAQGLGSTPGAWKEAYELSKRTGFMDVAGEHVFLDAPQSAKVIQSKAGAFLDAGQIFFRGGVKSLRAGSWYTAVKEFRDLHPTGAITDDDLKGILSRADLLSHNMSRASTSTLTTGIMAIPAQFYTYQLRLMELMMGKRLTGMEKMRLFAVNGALFGLPVGLGLSGTTFFGDQLKSYANQNGYTVGDSFIQDVAMQGLPAAIGQMITGHTLNIGERYGARGAEPVTEAAGLEGDKTFLQVFGGASLNSLSNTVAQSSGLMRVIMSGIRGDGGVVATPEDFAGPLKEITSVNSIFGIIAAVRYQNWLSKNNAVLRPNTPTYAIMHALTGLQDVQDSDIWTKSLDLKANKQYENKLQGMFESRFTLGVQEANQKNYDQASAYFAEAFQILHQGGFPEERIPEVVASAVKANEQTLTDRTNFNYFLKIQLPTQLGTK